MFQVKNFNSIIASMMNNVALMSDTLTDFNVGSNNRTMLEACARELDQLYQQFLEGLYEAIPVAIYKSFSFGRLQPTASSGYVTFNRDTSITPAADISIPAGTQVQSPGTNLIFTVNTASVLPAADNLINLLVTCTTTGSVGNVGSGSISQLPILIAGISSVSNGSMFINGTDLETDAQRQIRFQNYITSLSRSIKGAIVYGAEQVSLYDVNGQVTESVVDAVVFDPCVDQNPAGAPGYIDVYLWNGVNGASSALITAVQQALLGYIDSGGNTVPGWKAAGVVPQIYAVTEVSIPVTGAITVSPGYAWATVEAQVQAAIGAYFGSLGIGSTFRVSQMEKAVTALDGVEDFVLTAPTANVVPTYSQICVLGTLTLTQGS